MGFTGRWGRKLAAVAVGTATIVAMGMVVAPGANAYTYTRGDTRNVTFSYINPMQVTPPMPGASTMYYKPFSITPPRMAVNRPAGVAVNTNQSFQIVHQIWRYRPGAPAWEGAGTVTESGYIPAGYNSWWSSGNGQSHMQQRGNYYYIESTVTLYGFGWSVNASIRPSTVNDFSCAYMVCQPYNDYVYVA